MNGEFWRPEAAYRKQRIDIMAKRVADLLVDVLADAGVRRIYGVSGDSLNGITDSIRVRRNMEWVHLRHEETAYRFWPSPHRYPARRSAAGIFRRLIPSISSHSAAIIAS